MKKSQRGHGGRMFFEAEEEEQELDEEDTEDIFLRKAGIGRKDTITSRWQERLAGTEDEELEGAFVEWNRDLVLADQHRSISELGGEWNLTAQATKGLTRMLRNGKINSEGLLSFP